MATTWKHPSWWSWKNKNNVQICCQIHCRNSEWVLTLWIHSEKLSLLMKPCTWNTLNLHAVRLGDLDSPDSRRTGVTHTSGREEVNVTLITGLFRVTVLVLLLMLYEYACLMRGLTCFLRRAERLLTWQWEPVQCVPGSQSASSLRGKHYTVVF